MLIRVVIKETADSVVSSKQLQDRSCLFFKAVAGWFILNYMKLSKPCCAGETVLFDWEGIGSERFERSHIGSSADFRVVKSRITSSVLAGLRVKGGLLGGIGSRAVWALLDEDRIQKRIVKPISVDGVRKLNVFITATP